MIHAPRGYEGRGLISFRLSDVPLDIRLKAARSASARDAMAFKDSVKPELRLLAAVLDHVDDGRVGYERMKRVAERPSGKLYWIPRSAWERVMG